MKWYICLCSQGNTVYVITGKWLSSTICFTTTSSAWFRFFFIERRISTARFECQINIIKWNSCVQGYSVTPEKNSRCLHLRLHPVTINDGETHETETSALSSLITAWWAPWWSCNGKLGEKASVFFFYILNQCSQQQLFLEMTQWSVYWLWWVLQNHLSLITFSYAPQMASN